MCFLSWCVPHVSPCTALCGVPAPTDAGELSLVSPAVTGAAAHLCSSSATAQPGLSLVPRVVAVLWSPGCCWPTAVATHNTPI